jgi:hypothetical protein
MVGLLDDLDAGVPKYEWDPAGPTLIARKRGRYPDQLDIAVLFHGLCGFGLQDRISVIADKLIEIGRAVAPHSVRHRAGTGNWRLEPATGHMRPHAGQVRG